MEVVHGVLMVEPIIGTSLIRTSGTSLIRPPEPP